MIKVFFKVESEVEQQEIARKIEDLLHEKKCLAPVVEVMMPDRTHNVRPLSTQEDPYFLVGEERYR